MSDANKNVAGLNTLRVERKTSDSADVHSDECTMLMQNDKEAGREQHWTAFPGPRDGTG